jgi:hypothetical protein
MRADVLHSQRGKRIAVTVMAIALLVAVGWQPAAAQDSLYPEPSSSMYDPNASNDSSESTITPTDGTASTDGDTAVAGAVEGPTTGSGTGPDPSVYGDDVAGQSATPVPSGELPFTGSEDVLTALVAGALLLVAGLCIYLAMRLQPMSTRRSSRSLSPPR